MTVLNILTVVVWVLNILFAVKAYKDDKRGDLAWHSFVAGHMTSIILYILYTSI